ncbi:MAG: alpha-rhamnosidase, partial [Bacteroidales bacterium]|nr:alpha-rhamnosidase [Bacteroidales bacterium]
FWDILTDNITWPGTYVIIANMLYEQFGNKEPIIKHYASMKKWLDFVQKNYVEDHIFVRDTYGDWCMPPEAPELIHSNDASRITEAAVLSTTYYYQILQLMERFANLQGKADDAKAFADEAAIVKEAYNKKFFNQETAQYSNNTVTANILSLCYGMVPEGYEEKVFANIVNKTEGEFKSHVSVGLVGAQWLMRGLSNYGRADLAYTIATNRDYPSWGYMVENNATTIWELWNGNTADPAMNSHNHVMLLGDLIVWYYEYLAGIQNTAGSAGFKHITMKPYPVDGLEFVKASYRSVRGEIKSAWHRHEAHFHWDITVPGNAVATVYVPAAAKEQVKEGKQPAATADGVKFVKMDGQYAVFEVGSGNYSFLVEN